VSTRSSLSTRGHVAISVVSPIDAMVDRIEAQPFSLHQAPERRTDLIGAGESPLSHCLWPLYAVEQN
jgi:hypothetical protein